MNNRIDKIMPYALPILLFAIIGFYYYINPIMNNFPINCYWKALTGTQCPACGTQRALHALANGQFYEALTYNYFFVLSIPIAIAIILAEWYNYHHAFDSLRGFLHNQYTLITYVVLYFAWWIVRNLLEI